MAGEVQDYIAGLGEPERSVIAEIYARASELVPEAVEGLSYGMPSLLYKGKGLISVMSTKKHIGIYPFGALGEYTAVAEGAGLGTTKGSIYLGSGQHLPDGLLHQLILRRVRQLDES